MSFYTLLLVLVTVYLSSHSSVMLLILFHVMSFIIFKLFGYSCYLFLCFIPTYTLEVDMGNCKNPKVLLSLYETMNYKGPKATTHISYLISSNNYCYPVIICDIYDHLLLSLHFHVFSYTIKHFLQTELSFRQIFWVYWGSNLKTTISRRFVILEV